MKKLAVWALALLASTGLAAYQYHAIGLYTPSVLDGNQGEFNIGHRFYGVVHEDPVDTFFGMNAGANTNISYRHNLPLDIEAKLGYTFSLRQYELGTAWKIPASGLPAQAQVDVSFAWLDRPGGSGRATDLGAYASLQNDPLFDRLALTANLGYNTLYERLALGLGLNVRVLNHVSLLGEFYPLLNTDKGSPEAQALLGEYPSLSCGIKIDTHNHNFILAVGNADHFSPTRLALGADTKSDLHFGFNIKRRLSF